MAVPEIVSRLSSAASTSSCSVVGACTRRAVSEKATSADAQLLRHLVEEALRRAARRLEAAGADVGGLHRARVVGDEHDRRPLDRHADRRLRACARATTSAGERQREQRGRQVAAPVRRRAGSDAGEGRDRGEAHGVAPRAGAGRRRCAATASGTSQQRRAGRAGRRSSPQRSAPARAASRPRVDSTTWSTCSAAQLAATAARLLGARPRRSARAGRGATCRPRRARPVSGSTSGSRPTAGSSLLARVADLDGEHGVARRAARRSGARPVVAGRGSRSTTTTKPGLAGDAARCGTSAWASAAARRRRRGRRPRRARGAARSSAGRPAARREQSRLGPRRTVSSARRPAAAHGQPADDERDALGHVGLQAVGRAEGHRRRDVERRSTS